MESEGPFSWKQRRGGREEGKGGVCREKGDSQLLQISREAKKINQMIDTWSKSPSFDGRAGDLSADLLLKGALDLQESLVMLGKLQRSSELLTQSRRRFQGCSFREEAPPAGAGAGAGRTPALTGSGRFGSSRNGVEELRKVIRDSLYRENLLSGSSPKPPSPPPPSPPPPERPRAPNLIARLMGLEEAPPAAAAAVADKPDRSRKGLQDIIESMKVKGLLGATRSGETLLQSPALPYLRRLPGNEEEEPPIVIIKPMHLAAAAMEETKFSGEVEVGDPPEKIKSVASPPMKKTKEETRVRRKLEEPQMKNRSTRSQIKTTNPPPARRPERRPAPERNQVSVQRTSPSTKTAVRKSVESTRERKATKAKPVRRPPVPPPVRRTLYCTLQEVGRLPLPRKTEGSSSIFLQEDKEMVARHGRGGALATSSSSSSSPSDLSSHGEGARCTITLTEGNLITGRKILFRSSSILELNSLPIYFREPEEGHGEPQQPWRRELACHRPRALLQPRPREEDDRRRRFRAPLGLRQRADGLQAPPPFSLPPSHSAGDGGGGDPREPRAGGGDRPRNREPEERRRRRRRRRREILPAAGERSEVQQERGLASRLGRGPSGGRSSRNRPSSGESSLQPAGFGGLFSLTF